MRRELAIAARYIVSAKRKRLVSFMSFVSILGIGVGVACLITVIAVMNGFSSELEKRIIGQNPHIIIEEQYGINSREYLDLAASLSGFDEINGLYPFIWGQGVLNFRSRAQGAAFRSVDLQNPIDRKKIEGQICSGSLELEGNSLIIGKELSTALGAFTGDEIDVMTSFSSRPKRFKITGIFYSGMYEYDLNLAYIGLSKAAEIFDTAGSYNGIGLDLKDALKADWMKNRLLPVMPEGFYLRTWMELNTNLFAALKLEKAAMFVILTLIVIVAALNIISMLTVMVTDKRKDIGILKAVGATGMMIMNIFSFQGLIIGALGAVFGLCGGIGMVFILDKWRFPILPESIYYGINYLPVKISVSDFIIVTAAALIISLLASAYPAYQASRLEPVEALRYE
ncbi:MAG: ABC transporter permease [Candidatus Omnitrophica bacterium]|nr:ABC transporter permease [Candidatus Omnitrophota bacterium]